MEGLSGTSNEETAPEEGNNRTLHVLIAEDNPINQKIIVAMIAPLNCQFDIVENGLEAVAAVARSNYDVVLMDINMPEMDGLIATQKIRSLPDLVAGVPIIAVTANTAKGDWEKYMEVGMNDHVPKPIVRQDLLNAIAQWAKVSISDTSDPTVSATLSPETMTESPNEETAEELNNLMGDLDNLLDVTSD